MEQRLQLRVIRLLFPHRTRLLSSLANPHLLLTLSPNSRATGTMVALVILAIAVVILTGGEQLSLVELTTVALRKNTQLVGANSTKIL